ncbi:MAG: 3-hydroxyacyl-CoA dehydrogenase NAD-binding domain-containing protein, partial [Rhodospirillales bacterium]
MNIQTIGVIGAGQMGNGIAHVCALSGYNVQLIDVDQEHLDKGLQSIDGNLDRQIARGRIKPEEKA